VIGASSELRHRGNISLAYQVLLEQGYKREDVFILDTEGETPLFPFTDFTTAAAVRYLFEQLAIVIEPQDTLFVYLTGHGGRVTADEETAADDQREIAVATVSLNIAEAMPVDEIVRLLSKITPGVGIVFFDQCYGGVISTPGMCNYVIMTASTEDAVSHGNSFPRAFWSGFREQQGAPSVLHAFKHAMVSDPATRQGLQRPRIIHHCIDPASITVLGQPTSRESTPIVDNR